eukprot:scpid45024/ scgid2156/ IQ and ubiquitin-like domain-containing protein
MSDNVEQETDSVADEKSGQEDVQGIVAGATEGADSGGDDHEVEIGDGHAASQSTNVDDGDNDTQGMTENPNEEGASDRDAGQQPEADIRIQPPTPSNQQRMELNIDDGMPSPEQDAPESSRQSKPMPSPVHSSPVHSSPAYPSLGGSLPRHHPDYRMPDQLKVKVELDGEQHEVELEIIRYNDHKKPFLGGFMNRRNGKEYHHATAQTRPDYRRKSNAPRETRSTQTKWMVTREQQTSLDAATQMPRPDYHVGTDGDRIIIPGRYQTADELFALRLEKILVIQRAYRVWKQRRYLASLKKDKEEYDRWIQEDIVRREQVREDRLTEHYERTLHPKTKEDFDRLYASLEAWRVAKTEEINEKLGGADRKVALSELMDKEARLIAGAGRHRINAEEQTSKERVANYLQKTAAPRRWRAFDGKTTIMETDNIRRARQLKQMYEDITAPISTYNERLDALLLVKCTVQTADCPLTRDIIEQIERETECINRGLNDAKMDAMRKRLAVLFLQYIKNPMFNPEAARYNRVPIDSKKLVKNVHFCRSCRRYLPSIDFEISAHTRAVGRCKQCVKLDSDARTRKDLAYYRHLLKELRFHEAQYGDETTVAHLVQAADIRYLIDDVWKCQSMLSQETDPFELVFTRWDQSSQWTPWNCVLLNKEEYVQHKKLDNPEGYYGPGICQEVRKRHVESFIHFQSVPGLAGYLSKNNIKLSAVGQSKQPQQQHTASRSVSTEPRSAASTPAMQHQHAQ